MLLDILQQWVFPRNVTGLFVKQWLTDTHCHNSTALKGFIIYQTVRYLVCYKIFNFLVMTWNYDVEIHFC